MDVVNILLLLLPLAPYIILGALISKEINQIVKLLVRKD